MLVYYLVPLLCIVQSQYNFNLHFKSQFPAISCPLYHISALGLNFPCFNYLPECLRIEKYGVRYHNGREIFCHPDFQLNLTNDARIYNNYIVDLNLSITIEQEIQQTQLRYTTKKYIPDCAIIYLQPEVVFLQMGLFVVPYKDFDGYGYDYGVIHPFKQIKYFQNINAIKEVFILGNKNVRNVIVIAMNGLILLKLTKLVQQNEQYLEGHISCKTCDQYNKFISFEVYTRSYDRFALTCDCKQGYFEINQQSCSKCHYQCEFCEKQEENCLSCHLQTHQSLLNNKCKCEMGYFDTGIDIYQFQIEVLEISKSNQFSQSSDINYSIQSSNKYYQQFLDINSHLKQFIIFAQMYMKQLKQSSQQQFSLEVYPAKLLCLF